MEVTNEQLMAKLKQVEEFEAKWGENTTSRAWRKWCTDEQYRNREIKFRNSLAEYARGNAHKAFLTSDKSIL